MEENTDATFAIFEMDDMPFVIEWSPEIKKVDWSIPIKNNCINNTEFLFTINTNTITVPSSLFLSSDPVKTVTHNNDTAYVSHCVNIYNDHGVIYQVQTLYGIDHSTKSINIFYIKMKLYDSNKENDDNDDNDEEDENNNYDPEYDESNNQDNMNYMDDSDSYNSENDYDYDYDYGDGYDSVS